MPQIGSKQCPIGLACTYELGEMDIFALGWSTSNSNAVQLHETVPPDPTKRQAHQIGAGTAEVRVVVTPVQGADPVTYWFVQTGYDNQGVLSVGEPHPLET